MDSMVGKPAGRDSNALKDAQSGDRAYSFSVFAGRQSFPDNGEHGIAHDVRTAFGTGAALSRFGK